MKPSYLAAVLVLILTAFVVLWLLAGCERAAVEVEQTKPIGEPQYPRAVPVETPKPTPTPSGWIGIQADRWKRAKPRDEKIHFIQAIAATIQRNRDRYVSVEKSTGVPWRVVAVIHNMEGSLDFRTNLGQGDPLTAQSRHVPRGRPPVPPNPPFSWEYAAGDALAYDHMSEKDWRDIGHQLNNTELWNGAGYQKYHRDVPSPYLWSWSSISVPGRYIADGSWSSTAISNQAGAAMILKFLP